MVSKTMEEDIAAGFSPFTAGLRGQAMMDTFESRAGRLVKITAKGWSAERRCLRACNPRVDRPSAFEDLISRERTNSSCSSRRAAIDIKKEYKVPFIMHICGDTTNTMSHLPEMGVDCFSVDHKVNIAVAKQRIGKKIAIMGNVHPIEVALNGTPEDVTKASVECMRKAGVGGGLILSTGCETPRDCPDANIIAMGRAALERGKYPLKF
jgi:uroporphyrinogen decarboxylase